MRSEDVPGGFQMQQRLRFRFREQIRALDAVLQVYCDEVLVVGLTPLGTRLFSIRQRGLEIQVESELENDWPFSPERILLDVHRTFLYPLADPPLPDGVHALRVGSLTIEERWEGGRLVERTIPEVLEERAGVVVIRYEEGMTSSEPARRAGLENRPGRYELEVETLSRQELECPD
jgi:hypothetical protein